jgi:hypothetical protein
MPTCRNFVQEVGSPGSSELVEVFDVSEEVGGQHYGGWHNWLAWVSLGRFDIGRKILQLEETVDNVLMNSSFPYERRQFVQLAVSCNEPRDGIQKSTLSELNGEVSSIEGS